MADFEQKVDVFYNKLEQINDIDFQSYLMPLLEPDCCFISDSFSIEKLDHLNKLLEYYIDYGIYLPLPYDPRYKHIKNYEDYEYTYCIAYEMAIRTDKFYDIKAYHPYERNKQWIEDASSLGLDPSTYIFPEDMIILNSEYKFRLLYQSKRYISIDDYDNGLYLLIEYYLQREGIYQIDSTLKLEQIIVNDIKNEQHRLVDKIFKDYENYYIIIIDTIENKAKAIPLSKHIPAEQLDSNFIEKIEDNYIKDKNINAQPVYTRPTLTFKESRIINLAINLNLSKTELIAYLSKIKDDYDKKESIIQSPMELLGEKLEKAIAPKSLKKMPKKKTKKLAFAHAFCVYDLYKVLTPIFESKENAFKIKQDSGKVDKKDRNPYDKLELESEIASIVGISNDKVDYYHTLMKEYINGLKYKELISGFKNIKSET